MESNELKTVLSTTLPTEVLPGTSNQDKSRAAIKDLLTETLPSSDRKNLPSDLKWRFLLDKHSFSKNKSTKRKKTFLNRKQRKESGMLKLPLTGWNYDTLNTLRTMWIEYMNQNLDLVTRAPDHLDRDWNMFSNIVAKSELIGAELTVVQSKIPNQVGLSGTVVLETKMTFQIVTPTSQLKTIVKNSAVFQFHLNDIRFTVYGKYIATRPSERSVKKIKCFMIPEL